MMERGFRYSPLFSHDLQFPIFPPGNGPRAGGGWGDRVLKTPLKHIVIPGYCAGGDTVSIWLGTSLWNQRKNISEIQNSYNLCRLN